jgi:hypothetical protein
MVVGQRLALGKVSVDELWSALGKVRVRVVGKWLALGKVRVRVCLLQVRLGSESMDYGQL